jgi:hypothetical protein
MRVFLSLLVPFFLSFACAHEEYFYSVAWDGAATTCDEGANLLSLVAIEAAVNGVLATNSLAAVTTWTKEFTLNYGGRELEQSATLGQRELCHQYTCQSACCRYQCCSELHNCDECRRRQLIQTERVLTSVEISALQNACEVALNGEGQSTGTVEYSGDCKTAMIAATCNALVYTSEDTDDSGASVCENYAVHADEVEFAGAVTKIYGGDLYGTNIIGTPTFMGGGVIQESDGFATCLDDTLAAYTASHVGEIAMPIVLEA